MIQDYNEYKLNNKERIALIAISAGFLLIAGFLYINSFITVVISPIAYGFLSQRQNLGMSSRNCYTVSVHHFL